MDEKLTRDRLNFASKKLREMRERKILTDVVIKCQEGNIFAHKCVLMATNQFFYNIFSKGLESENTEIELEFKDVSMQVLSIIITTLYGGIPRDIKEDTTQIIKVMETSYIIEERLLFKYCLQLLMKGLNVDNCADVWNVTVKYELVKEEYQVMAFITQHLSKIIKHNKLADVTVDQMTDLITYASGILDDGDQLLLIIIAWGKKNQAERIENTIRLFNLVEKLHFSNYSALRFEVEYFAQNSFRLKMRLQPLVNRLTSHSRQRHSLKPVSTHSAPIPVTIAPPPSSVSSGDTQVNCFRKPLKNTFINKPKAIAFSENNFIVSPPPSSIVNSICSSVHFNSSISSNGLSVTSLYTPQMIQEISLNMNVHFFHSMQAPIMKMSVGSYSITQNKWISVNEVPLPNFVTRSWCPLMSSKGDRFYFGITTTKNYIAFCETSGETYIGPLVSFRSQVTGVSDGKLMYVWNYEFIGQFNSESKVWKSIKPNLHIVSNCSNLLAMNGDLYIHAVFPPILYKYEFDKESWIVKKVFPEKPALKSIKSQCCCTEACTKQLYFYTNEKQLVIYDLLADSEQVLFLPELETGVPLLSSCDQTFIVFVCKKKPEYFFYYPETNEIRYLVKHDSQLENINLVTCELSVV